MCSVDFICCCNIGDEGDNNDTTNIVSSSINVNNIDAESTDTVSSIVRACDTDVSYQNRSDDLDLATIPKEFILVLLL